MFFIRTNAKFVKFVKFVKLKNKLKLKRSPLLLENDEYTGYTYNENNTVVFIGGKNPKYYYKDYKINVVKKPIAVLDLLKTNSNYYVSDFF